MNIMKQHCALRGSGKGERSRRSFVSSVLRVEIHILPHQVLILRSIWSSSPPPHPHPQPSGYQPSSRNWAPAFLPSFPSFLPSPGHIEGLCIPQGWNPSCSCNLGYCSLVLNPPGHSGNSRSSVSPAESQVQCCFISRWLLICKIDVDYSLHSSAVDGLSLRWRLYICALFEAAH